MKKNPTEVTNTNWENDDADNQLSAEKGDSDAYLDDGKFNDKDNEDM